MVVWDENRKCKDNLLDEWVESRTLRNECEFIGVVGILEEITLDVLRHALES